MMSNKKKKRDSGAYPGKESSNKSENLLLRFIFKKVIRREH